MNKLFTLIATLLFSVAMYAQFPGGMGTPNRRGNSPQKMEFNPEQFVKELKDFIINEAQLTPSEANRFFPLLFEMHDKTRKIQDRQRELSMKAMMGENQMTEAQYAKTIDQITKLEVSAKEVEQQYYKKFHTVLSWKKIYKVRVAINRFHMRALGKFQPGRGNNGNPQRGTQGINNQNKGWQNGR